MSRVGVNHSSYIIRAGVSASMHAYCVLQEQQPGLQNGELGCSLLVVQARGIQLHSIYQRVFKITQKPSACTIITSTGGSLHIWRILHLEPVNGTLTEIENRARGDEQSPHLVSVRWCQIDSHHNHRTQILKLLWNILIQLLHLIACRVTPKCDQQVLHAAWLLLLFHAAIVCIWLMSIVQ